MYVLVLIVIGGLVGWLAGVVMRTSVQQGLLMNVVIGIVGSFIGNGLLAGLFRGTRSIGSWPPSPGALLAAFVGALLLIALLKVVVRARVRIG